MYSLLVIILKLFESVELLQTSIIKCMYSLLVIILKLFESVELLETSIVTMYVLITCDYFELVRKCRTVSN